MRIRTTSATAYDRLSLGLGLLLGFVVLSGVGFPTRWRAGRGVSRTWSRHWLITPLKSFRGSNKPVSPISTAWSMHSIFSPTG